MEEQFVNKSRVSVREISKAVARDFIEKHHYTHKFSSTRYTLGVFYREETEHMFFSGDNEQLIGCMTYGHPVSNRTVNSIVDDLELDEVLELTRLVCLDGYGKNLESFVIAQSFDWMKKNDPKVKVLVSYADPEQAHTGGIYRATNWIYQGCGYSKLMPDYSIRLTEDDLWIHSRSVGAKFGNKNIDNLAKSIGHTFWRKEETAKHRYIYFLCNKKEKKRMMKNLKIPVIPYNDIKEYVQLIQKVHVKDGVIEKIEILQGVDNGWKPQEVQLKTRDGKRIIVVCTSRSSGAAIANFISIKYNLKDYSEVFADNEELKGTYKQKINQLKKLDNYIIRVTSTTFLQAKECTYETFPWEMFDKIIIVERDIVKTCASWYITSHSQMNGHSEARDMHDFLQKELQNPTDIPILQDALENIVEDVHFFYSQVKPYVLNMYSNTSIISCELIQTPQEYFLPELSRILGDEITAEHVYDRQFPRDYSDFIEKVGFDKLVKHIIEKKNAILGEAWNN